MQYSFCPKCGHPLEARMIDGMERLVCSSCRFVFYQNSKPCTSVLTLDQNKLLLVQRAIEPFKDYWDIPGGFLEAGEHPKAGAIREMAEETGLLVELIDDLGVFMDTYGETGEPTLNFCYVARVVGGKPQAASDAMQMQWFDLQALPKQIAFGWSKEALELLQQRYAEPSVTAKVSLFAPPAGQKDVPTTRPIEPEDARTVKPALAGGVFSDRKSVVEDIPTPSPVESKDALATQPTDRPFSDWKRARKDTPVLSSVESKSPASPALAGGLFGGQVPAKEDVPPAAPPGKGQKNTAKLTSIMEGTLHRAISERVGLSANTLYVDASYHGPENGTEEQPYRTIAGALARAIAENTIVVAPGLYRERVRLKERVTLVSQITGTAIIHGGADRVSGRPTVIGANGAALMGFTITGGCTGILCEGTSPVIRHNIIRGNFGDYGLACTNRSRATIQNNTILANLGSETNGLSIGVYVENAEPVLYNNIISGNSIGYVSYHSNAVERYNNVWNNRRNFGRLLKPGRGTISVDPGFVDPVVGDYRLQPDSPCRNAGQDPEDRNTPKDIGAFDTGSKDVVEMAWDSLPKVAKTALLSFPYISHIQRRHNIRWESALDEQLGRYWAMPGDEILFEGDRLISNRHADKWFATRTGDMDLPVVHFGNVRQRVALDESTVAVPDQQEEKPLQQLKIEVPCNAISGWVFIKVQGLESNPVYLEIRRPY